MFTRAALESYKVSSKSVKTVKSNSTHRGAEIFCESDFRSCVNKDLAVNPERARCLLMIRIERVDPSLRKANKLFRQSGEITVTKEADFGLDFAP